MLSIQNLHAQQIQYGQVKQWKSYSLTFRAVIGLSFGFDPINIMWQSVNMFWSDKSENGMLHLLYCWFSHNVTKSQTTKLSTYWDFTFMVY